MAIETRDNIRDDNIRKVVLRELAWTEGYRRVVLESDSLIGIQLIKEGSEDGPYGNIIYRIRQWMRKEWQCKLNHTWREGNGCADSLAKWSHQQELGLTVLDRPADVVKRCLNEDLRGVASSRYITL
ncbi:uncharacterized protein LOC113767819 [Coffea eugenioides]|uniref:uncharacterized protein LOC113767819 n=1 Tax=Coffea eugenioides TaxID=49369 RepID=UPI000F613734|nr:uncharacterized protein LOC113767819 [Coffea eugenioides]